MTDKDASLSTRKFSSLTGLSVAAITKMLRKGRLKGMKVSGKWRIPEDQLRSDAIAAAPVRDGGEPAGAESSADRKTYSVAEFAAMTYLTEYGVSAWLKNGRLKGQADPQGLWRVDAASLTLPHVQRLLRP